MREARITTILSPSTASHSDIDSTILFYIISAELQKMGGNIKAKISSFIHSLLLAYLICQLSGCSLINPIRDRTIPNPPMPEQVIITGDKSVNIKSGTTIDVLLRSGQVVKGKYSGMIPIPKEEYSERYVARKEKYKDEVTLPEMGESIVLLTKDGNQNEGDFFGFDFGAIRFKKTDSKMIGTWYINVVDSIVDNEGRRIESETLILLMKEGKVAFLSSIVLRIKKQESRIELDDVSQIQIKARARKSNKLVFYIIGLIAVGALFYLLLREMAEGVASVVQNMK